MTEIEENLASASDALEAFASGPGQAAADALEAAFGRAGNSIERALGKAARSGELDFKRMAESILSDLARIAAEAIIAQSGLGTPSQTINVSSAPGRQDNAGGLPGSLATLIASAAARGGRYL